MDLDQLNEIACAMVAPGKGILAADESTGTIGKRFASINLDSTPDSRRDWREMLFRTEPAMSDRISCGTASPTITSWVPASRNGAP